MRNKINIVTPAQFMKHFVKGYYPKSKKNLFSSPPEFAVEKDMYEWITSAINDSDAVNSQQWFCASTPFKPDPLDTTRQVVDCGIYPREHAPVDEGDSPHRRVNWSRIDLSIECKLNSTDQDPFDNTTPSLQPIAEERKKTLGQILSYAELVFKHQYRAFHYMILFLGHESRIVRFDRSGIFATHKFDYTKDGDILYNFLKQYTRWNDADRGHDPTATRLEPDNPLCEAMRTFGKAKAMENPECHKQKAFNASLDPNWPWYLVEVHIREESKKGKGRGGRTRRRSIRTFVVGKPHFEADGVIGRGTRGYVAVEVKDRKLVGPFVYLKDAWRVDHPGIEQEGAVLTVLNENGVRFVPHLVCHGEIDGQVTRSQDVWKSCCTEKPPPECSLKRHQHYRLVVAEVGKSLEEFESGIQLMNVLYCCVLAHMEAYTKAGIIHRDISAGNTLLYQADNGVWMGLLNDWEVSKKADVDTARQLDRTGTWQFMSAHALNDPTKEIVIADELEALFHVLIYFAIRFLPHNCEKSEVPQFLSDYFDGYTTKDKEYRCGRAKQAAMMYGEIDITAHNPHPTSLKFLMPNDPSKKHTLSDFVDKLLRSFKALYCADKPVHNPIQPEETFSSSSQDDFIAVMRAMGFTRDAADSTPTSSPEPTQAGPSQPAAPLAIAQSMDADIISLKEHGPIIALFEEFIVTHRKKWPSNDKGEDLRAGTVKLEFTHDLPAVMAQPTRTTGSKKRRSEAEPGPSRRPSKRNKTKSR